MLMLFFIQDPEHVEIVTLVVSAVEDVTGLIADLAHELAEFTKKTLKAIEDTKRGVKNCKESSDTAKCLKVLKEIAHKSYNYVIAVDELCSYGAQIDHVIQAIKNGDFLELNGFFSKLLEYLIKCETAHQPVQEAYNVIEQTAQKAADTCKTEAEEAKRKESKVKKRGVAAVTGTMALATATGVILSVFAGVATFGVGTVVGLAVTAAGTFAAGGFVSAATLRATHGITAAKLEQLRKEYELLKEVYTELQTVATSVLDKTYKMRSHLNAIHRKIERVKKLKVSHEVYETLEEAVKHLGDEFTTSYEKSSDDKAKLKPHLN